MRLNILQYFARVAAKLRHHELAHGPAAINVPMTELMDLDFPEGLPSWRDEADSKVEYLIRYARAVGVHARDDFGRGLICRLTRDAADEASITWHGKQHDQ